MWYTGTVLERRIAQCRAQRRAIEGVDCVVYGSDRTIQCRSCTVSCGRLTQVGTRGGWRSIGTGRGLILQAGTF